jgi:hypothetical protein
MVVKPCLSVCLSVCPMSEATPRILIKHDIWCLQQNFLGKFNFDLYQTNITPTSLFVKIKFYEFVWISQYND